MSAFGEITFRLGSSPFSSLPRLRQFHTGAPRFGQANCNGLLWRTRAMFPFADVFHFFADKFASLGGWRFAFPLVFASSFDDFFFGHGIRFSPGSH